MSDFDARLNRPKPTKLDRIISDLADTDPDRHKELVRVIHDVDTYNHSLIANTLTEDWGIPVSQHTVRIWRNRNV